MGMSSIEWSAYLHDDDRARRSAPRRSTTRSSGGCSSGIAPTLPLVDGAVDVVRVLAESISARRRLLVEPSR